MQIHIQMQFRQMHESDIFRMQTDHIARQKADRCRAQNLINTEMEREHVTSADSDNRQTADRTPDSDSRSRFRQTADKPQQN
ncbi:hypothetical protein Tco_0855332 [Tanacetum coccineum]